MTLPPDPKTFLATLSPATKAQLVAKSDRAGLRHLALHGGAALGLGALIAAQVPGWMLLVPVQGVVLVFLFTLEHECTHQTPFARPWLNEIVGRVCALVLVLPFLWFRYFHLAHHRHTNVPGLDPELAGPVPETLRGWVWHVSGLPYWRSELRLLGRLARGAEAAAYLPATALPRMQREARWMILFYAAAGATLFWSPVLLWVWLVPVLMGQPVLRLYLLAEHGDCPRVANLFQNTRTTYTTALVRSLAWNMPYHTEHHVFPAVPFHHLPDLHQQMRDHLAVTAPGYTAFSRAYLARRLKSPPAG